MGRRMLAGAGTLALLCGLGLPAAADLPPGVEPERRSVPGLENEAEIIVDHWGVPHIYAQSDRDALFLQGYNAARDRLWQIDLWRKRGLGLLAESFGAEYVDQDRAARLFLYRGDMESEWEAYGPNGRAYAEAFVDGVNAYVRQVLDGELPLPVEFEATGTEPDLWSPEDVVQIRSHGLTRNAASEVLRARMACAAGLEADWVRRKLEPEWQPAIPDGLDPCVIPEDVLADYRLATKAVEFQKAPSTQASLENREFLAEADQAVDRIGSNNWAIAPSRTETGRPILANDPHRAHGVPSLRYVAHLDSPTMSVIGAGEPALPGISIGHNGTIAFGLTIFSVDQEDLYVYELNPENPDQYRYGDEWVDMEVVTETIEVRDGEPQEATMRFTRHGPVLKVEPQNDRAFALRTVWLEPGTSAYFGSVDYMTAQNWDEFSAAMERFSTPSENQVYADVEGNIGWIVGAMTPRRENWDGLLPVPGNGTYEWQFLDRADLPSEYNPERGWVATANEMNLPEDFPYEEHRIGFEWADPSRSQRIEEVLSENSSVSLADAMALQLDDTNMLGRRLVALLESLELPPDATPAVADALEMLQGWDGVVSAESAPAVVAEIMLSETLPEETIERVLPREAREIVDDGSITAVMEALETPDERLGEDPEATRDAVLVEALTRARTRAAAHLGADPENWRWGLLHRAMFEHAVAPLAGERLAEQMAVGPLAMGGSATTPRAASYNDDFEVSSGASFRMVLDVGNWDASRFINSPGQSGDPFSAHYRDLAPLWAAGLYAPLLYSREAVEESAAHVLALSPAR